MPRRDIEFKATDGTVLRGWFYSPPNYKDAKLPCVILTHGFTATKEIDLDLFAEYFTSHIRLHCLVYDNRCFGSSEGSPRFEIIPSLQISDIQDAITLTSTLPEVDPGRIAIWGSSYSGANVLQVASQDRRIKAVLCQGPMTNGRECFRRLVGSVGMGFMRELFTADRVARMKGEEPGVVPVVTNDPQGQAALPGLEAYGFFMGAKAKRATTWENKVTIRSLELIAPHNPDAFIKDISPTPLLMTVMTDDIYTPTDLALAAYHDAREPKQLQLLEGGHFDSYDGVNFKRNASTQTEFLKKWLQCESTE